MKGGCIKMEDNLCKIITGLTEYLSSYGTKTSDTKMKGMGIQGQFSCILVATRVL
jgi:hypothetical protein